MERVLNKNLFLASRSGDSVTHLWMLQMMRDLSSPFN